MCSRASILARWSASWRSQKRARSRKGTCCPTMCHMMISIPPKYDGDVAGASGQAGQGVAVAPVTPGAHPGTVGAPGVAGFGEAGIGAGGCARGGKHAVVLGDQRRGGVVEPVAY